MILDADDNEIVYVPISGLAEGQNSDEITFFLDGPITGKLVATDSDFAQVWARNPDTLVYQNISINPMDLTPFNVAVPYRFKAYVQALSTLSQGLERVALTVMHGINSPAGWSS